MNIPHDQLILKMQSKTFCTLSNDPGALFEWHQVAKKLYVVRRWLDNSNLREGVLIAEGVKTPTEAKQAVAAYAQGYVHGLESVAERKKAVLT